MKKAVDDAEKKLKSIEKRREARPRQLKLFELVAVDEPEFSSTIELYDAIPKYHWGKRPPAPKEDGLLGPLERKFSHKGKDYKVTIVPAYIEDRKGEWRQVFPGKREEFVEDALRKIAVDKKGVYIIDQASVFFTLYELRKELKKMGHTYSNAQLREAIHVCQGANMILEDAGGSIMFRHALFGAVGLMTKEDWKRHGKNAKCVLQFHPLVTDSINQMTYRPINYPQVMGYKEDLARWFYKRLAHQYLQAGFGKKYEILLSTIIQNSSMKPAPRLRKNLEKVRNALKVMQSRGDVMIWKEEKILEGRRIVDAKFIIQTSIPFNREITRANVKMKELRKINRGQKPGK